MINKINNPITRNFKGIWIPKDIYLNDDLNWTEKILLIEIDSLDDGNGCFASNKHFSGFLGVSERTITSTISNLKNKGFIKNISFNGRKRIIKIRLEENFQSDTKFISNETRSKLLPYNIYINNTSNNTINKDKKDKSFLNENSNNFNLSKDNQNKIKKQYKQATLYPELKTIKDKIIKLGKLDNNENIIIDEELMTNLTDKEKIILLEKIAEDDYTKDITSSVGINNKDNNNCNNNNIINN